MLLAGVVKLLSTNIFIMFSILSFVTGAQKLSKLPVTLPARHHNVFKLTILVLPFINGVATHGNEEIIGCAITSPVWSRGFVFASTAFELPSAELQNPPLRFDLRRAVERV